MQKEITARDVGSLQWMTLAECANDVKVAAEVVRGWCVAFEDGDPAGLPSAHYGAKLDPKRKSRRVHVDDWQAFKAARRQRQQQQDRTEMLEDRRVGKLVASMPFQYAGRRASKIAAGAGRGL